MLPVLRQLARLVALTFLLSAPALVPMVQGMGDAVRWIGRPEPLIGITAIPFELMLLGQVAPRDLAHVLFPYPLIFYVGDSYVGLLPVLLSLFSLLLIRRRWIVGVLAGLGLYSLLSWTGEHLGFAQINFHIPLLNMIREPDRHLIVFVMATGALSAFGLDSLRESPLLVQWRRHLAVILGFAALAGLA